MKRHSMLMVALILTLLAGCVPSQETTDVYYIMFDRPPNIFDTSVYSMGTDIGDIVSQEIGLNHGAKFTITIAPEYADLMRENAVFYASRGLLTYATISPYGEPLALESKILGFNSKSALYWFRAKSVLGQPSRIAREKATALFEIQ